MSKDLLTSFKTVAHNVKVYFFWSIFALGFSVLCISVFAFWSQPYTLKISPSPFGFQLVNEEFYMAEMRARVNYDAVKPKPVKAIKHATPTPRATAIVRAPLSNIN